VDDWDLEGFKQESDEQQTVVEQSDPSGKKKSKVGRATGGAGALAALLLKFKAIIIFLLGKLHFLLVGLKYLKFAKVFTTMGSMLITVVIDAMRWGWGFAIGFVLLLFVHETGHMLAIRAKGLNAGAPVFIPFVGALITMREMPHDAKSEAEIGIAGPLLGTAGALICLWLGGPGKMQIFTRLAYVGFLINLFNLLPVLPLDGGRVMAAISPKVWLVGLVLTVAMFMWIHNPIFLLLVILSIGRMLHAFKMKPEELDYYKVPSSTRFQMTLYYFGLAAFLAAMMMRLHQYNA